MVHAHMQVVYATADCGGEVRSQRYASILRVECLPPPWASLKTSALNMLRVGDSLVGKSGLCRWRVGSHKRSCCKHYQQGGPEAPLSSTPNGESGTMLRNARWIMYGISRVTCVLAVGFRIAPLFILQSC